MKNGRNRLIAWSCFLALLLPATVLAQTNPGEQTNAPEENAGYGYHIKNGTPSLAMDSAAVFAPDQGVILVDPSNESVVQQTFQAEDLGDGTWSLPDPETGANVVAKVQYAASVYATDPAITTPTQTALPVVPRDQVSILPLIAPRIFRIRLGYTCDLWSSCPGGWCQNGTITTTISNHRICRWTGRFWNVCVDFLAPVCRTTHYTCRDCTGPFWHSLNLRYVCGF